MPVNAASAKGKRRQRDYASAHGENPPLKVEDRPQRRFPLWMSGIAFLLALFAALLVYEPAIHGEFVFDDHTLPFKSAHRNGGALQHWLSSVRPVLMFSYWVNYQISGRGATLSYHLGNLVIHSVNAILVGAILWRILGWISVTSRRRWLLALTGACVFLLHPLQSESVAYIAGRSESLSALWCLGALTISLYRPAPSLSWGRAFAIAGLFGLALATKEHTVALPGVLLLTDIFSSRSSVRAVLRRNWRVYALLAAGSVVGTVAAWRVVAQSTSAGFQVAGIQWHEYAMTQARVVWAYVRLFLLPMGLTVDHDVALSRSLADGGSGIAVLCWIAVAAAVIVSRRRHPIACYGFLVFLVLLSPTSSIVPIKDVMAERRMYLPMLGLVLVALEFVARARVADWKAGTMAVGVVAALGTGAYQRSKDWSDSERLWLSAITATPAKARPYGNLASVYLSQRQCDRALKVFERAERAGAPAADANHTAVWALALECGGDPAGALEKMKASVALEADVHTYAALGRMYISAGKLAEAEHALAKAELLNPAWELTYLYRARLKLARSDYPGASAELRRVLSLNPMNPQARHLLEQTGERSRSIL